MNLDKIMEAAAMSTAAYQKGMEMGARHEREKFEIVIKAYDKALLDQSVVIPTALHMALEHARSELDKANRHADAAMQRDAQERFQGRPEQDQDVVGRALRAGM